MSSLFLAVFAYGDHCADTLSHSGSLSPTDYVGISFWLATAIMLAATVFFFVERDRAQRKWKTSPTVACLVTSHSQVCFPLTLSAVALNEAKSSCHEETRIC